MGCVQVSYVINDPASVNILCSNIDYTNELWDMTEQYKEILSRVYEICFLTPERI